MSYTSIYNFYYLDPYTGTDSVIDEEMKRLWALETQLFELYSLFGNGVLSGWEIEAQSNNNIIFITPGTGHIGYKSAVSVEKTPVTLSVPSGFVDTSLKYYIYASETENTNVNREVNFFASINIINYNDYNSQTNNRYNIGPGGLIRIGEIILKINKRHYNTVLIIN